MTVRGDDFTWCVPKPALDWMEAAIAEHYAIKVAPRMGPGPQDAKEGRFNKQHHTMVGRQR